ncbi:MAG TPA: hypothetical protein VK087_07145 [Tissierellaceae bacterium]|nr:hypothetical protein [Tissierellaceae bacterium]
MKSKTISLEEKRGERYLREELKSICLDIGMIEEFNKEEITEDYKKSLIEFLNTREEIKGKFQEWLSNNFNDLREAIVFWYYIAEDFQNLLLPDLEDLDLLDPNIINKLDRLIADGLEKFHMSCMKTYIEDKVGDK